MVVSQIVGSIILGHVGFDWFMENLNCDIQMKIFSQKYINEFRYLTNKFYEHVSFNVIFVPRRYLKSPSAISLLIFIYYNLIKETVATPHAESSRISVCCFFQ